MSDSKQIQNVFKLALSMALSLSFSTNLPVYADTDSPITPLRKVSVDDNRKVIFEFAADGAKTPNGRP